MPESVNADNAPMIGPLDAAKQARWHADREACWQRFREAAELAMRQPGRAARRETVAHYGRQHGPLAEQSLEAYVVHLWEKRRARSVQEVPR